MADPEEGPNWFWRLCELWGITWPGHAKVKAAPTGPAPLCSACHNPTKLDRQTGKWRCTWHPDAPTLSESPADHG